MEDLTIRNSADAREAYHGLADLRALADLLDRAKHRAAVAEAGCSALDGFAATAAAELDAAIGDMELSSRIARLEDALSVWEERGTSEPGRLMKTELV